MEDCSRIAAVHVAASQETYRGIFPDAVLDALSVPDRAERWRESMTANPDHAVLIAEEANNIVGFADGGPRRGDELDQAAEVYALYVLRHAQRRGIGSGLIAMLATDFDARGWLSLCLWVARDNHPARKFYEHLGGECVAEKVVQHNAYELCEVAYAWSDLRTLRRR
jgi:ribosomal protein S18 acetylase RimI-like enzyme